MHSMHSDGLLFNLQPLGQGRQWVESGRSRRAASGPKRPFDIAGSGRSEVAADLELC